MAHIAFFNIPALGHINPTLSVAAELVRRGHRVTYPAIDARARLIADTGAQVPSYVSSRPSDTDAISFAPEPRDYLGRSLLNFLAEMELTLPQLSEVFSRDRPDVVAFDRMAFAGHMFAAQNDIPMVQMWPMMASGPYWSIAEFAPFDPAHPDLLTYQAKLEKFLAEQGMQMTPEEFLAPKVHRHLAFFPRVFQNRGELFDDSYAFVGPCVRRAAGTWSPSGRKKVVLISLGSLHNNEPDFYRQCFQALADTDWHVVLPVGKRFDASALGTPPANFDVMRMVAQVDVLAHARAFVSHAGMGGVMEAAAAGVPQIVMPRTPEQEVNAARLAILDAGRTLSDPARLREVLDTLDTPGLPMLQREIAAAGGASASADIIESAIRPVTNRNS